MSSPTPVSTATLSGPKSVRNPNFWYPDGDTLLSVKSTGAQTVHLFRVHKLFLMLHSPIFREWLADQKSGLDSSQAVSLARTSPRVLEYFLYALYNPYADIPIQILNDIDLCDGFLKLCEEFKARSICTPLLKRLYSIWPETLSAWDNTEAYIFASAQEYPKMKENSHGETKMIFHDDMFPEPASAIRLGQLYNISNICIAALYHLSRIDPSSDYFKMHTAPTRSDVDSQRRLNAGLRSARWALLTTQDHAALSSLKDYIQSCLTRLMAESTSHVICQSGMEQTYSDIVRSSMATRDVLRVLKVGFDEPHRICSSCMAKGRKVTSSMRMDIWDQIPVILGLQRHSSP
ncbi:hypothetical protein BYT27DRAFT_7337537 [Phlegmacium glaucopus]|nr:hypothetical protein BYT27DRAFT_7337537 [Phlegmacium glaucopus]